MSRLTDDLLDLRARRAKNWDNKDLRLKLDRQIQKLEARVADEKSEQVTDALNAPLRALKSQVSGDASGATWFPEGANTVGSGGSFSELQHGIPALPQEQLETASNVAGTVADVVLDPLNAAAGGLNVGSKMLSGARQIPGAVASLSNYINNWYAPNVIDKATGSVGWGLGGASSMLEHMVNPVSRAKWAEMGTTSPAQARVARFIDDAEDTRGVEKATSQVQYTSSHIPQQTGHGRSTMPAAQEIHNRSFLSDYTPYSTESLSDSLQQFGGKQIASQGGKTPSAGSKVWNDAQDVNLSKKDADIVSQQVDEFFGGQVDDFIIKAPSAKQTGGHFHDVVARNPAKKALQDGFKANMDANGNVDPQKLAAWLSERQGEYNSKLQGPKTGKWEKLVEAARAKWKGEDVPVNRTRDSWKVMKADEDGVWLRGSMLGSAITEGGVGWVMKVEPNGNMRAFMIDKHDFFEKMGAEKVIPGKVIAVTPAMNSNIKYVGGGSNKKLGYTPTYADGSPAKATSYSPGQKRKQRPKQVQYQAAAPSMFRQAQPQSSGENYMNVLTEYANARPSGLGVLKQIPGAAGSGLFGQRLMSNLSGDNE